MGRLIALALALLQCGCFGVGLGVADYRQRTWVHRATMMFPRSDGDLGPFKTEAELRADWGQPEVEGMTPSGCRVLEYDAGLAWSGVIVWLIVPIPLVVPTGRSKERVYLRDDRFYARAIEGSEERNGLEILCSGLGCEATAGAVPRRSRPSAACIADPCAPDCDHGRLS